MCKDAGQMGDAQSDDVLQGNMLIHSTCRCSRQIITATGVLLTSFCFLVVLSLHRDGRICLQTSPSVFLDGGTGAAGGSS